MKAIVIRLKGVETSETLAQACIDSGKTNGVIIYPFDGVYGETQIAEKHQEFGIRPWREKMKKGRIGVKGCFLSHYSIWLHCADTQRPIAVFEHDAYVLRPIPKNIETEFQEFLMLDPYNKNSKHYGSLHQDQSMETHVSEYFNENSQRKYGIQDQYVMGTQAYIIKPSAAQKLIAHVKQNGYYPADLQCNKSLLNIQTMYPSIASLNPMFYGNRKLIKEESTTQKKW